MQLGDGKTSEGCFAGAKYMEGLLQLPFSRTICELCA
jgi:hypothetical protein